MAYGLWPMAYGLWPLLRRPGHALADHILDRDPEELRVRVRVVDRHAQEVAVRGVVHLEAAIREPERVDAGLAVGRARARRVREQLGGGAAGVGLLDHLELEAAR